ncbi:MAG: hypothetical protein M3Z31_10340 [Pseudomonadota bacterium]|nr:hypothetical protein [Pseudomonadota bacterium]
MRRIAHLARFGLVITGLFAAHVPAAPLSSQEVTTLCAQADGLAHCGRLVEATQLSRNPGLASRDGDTLNVTLYPAGRTAFTDSNDSTPERSFSLWDYFDAANIVVIYATRGDDATFLLLQRTNGRVIEVPAEPVLSPDYQRIATADVCEKRCANEVALWRVSRDGVRKEATWSPSERWTDASVRWKSADVVEIDYTGREGSSPRIMQRRIDQNDWKRVGPR